MCVQNEWSNHVQWWGLITASGEYKVQTIMEDHAFIGHWG
jgi:hypothetical protein